jgi:hypothetical protein
MISGCQPRGGLATCRRLPVAGPAILECLSTPKSTARALLVEVLADGRRVAALFTTMIMVGWKVSGSVTYTSVGGVNTAQDRFYNTDLDKLLKAQGT